MPITDENVEVNDIVLLGDRNHKNLKLSTLILEQKRHSMWKSDLKAHEKKYLIIV